MNASNQLSLIVILLSPSQTLGISDARLAGLDNLFSQSEHIVKLAAGIYVLKNARAFDELYSKAVNQTDLRPGDIGFEMPIGNTIRGTIPPDGAESSICRSADVSSRDTIAGASEVTAASITGFPHCARK